jgi:hypothetical protein
MVSFENKKQEQTYKTLKPYCAIQLIKPHHISQVFSEEELRVPIFINQQLSLSNLLDK